MKNKIIYVFLAFVIVSLLPMAFVSAENTEKTEKGSQAVVPTENTIAVNLQALIEQLQNQIKELQEKLAKLKTEVQEVKEEVKLTKNLRKGLSDDEVKELQKFLSQYREIYPEGLISGYFGPLTEKAIKKFQEKFDIPATGLVGPLTRDKINSLWSEKKITICHYPPENPSGKHSLEIGESALEAHLAHGDSIGRCVETQPILPPTPITPVPISTPATPAAPAAIKPSPLQIGVAPWSPNFVPGDINVKMIKLGLGSSDGFNNNVVINKLVIGEKNGAGCYFRNFQLLNYSGALPVMLALIAQPDANCQATFENLNLAMPKRQGYVSMDLVLAADILPSAPTGAVSLGVIEVGCFADGCPSGIAGLPAYTNITIVSRGIPAITTLYPDGGEKWVIGKPHTFKWETKNLPPDASITIRLFLMGSNGVVSNPPELAGLKNDSSETWVVPNGIYPGEYITDIAADYGISGYYYRIADASNSRFTIGQ